MKTLQLLAHQRKYLKLIAQGGCSRTIGYVRREGKIVGTKRLHGACFKDGHRPNAKYSADRCCDRCIAWAALHPEKVPA